MTKLAEAALRCPFDKGVIAYDCKALTTWISAEDAVFDSDKGNLTLLSLLEDSNPKLRQIAAKRGFYQAGKFFEDGERAARILAVAAKETDAPTAKELGRRVTLVPAEKLGLQAELFALTKHADAGLREALAWTLLGSVPRAPTAFDLAMAEKITHDGVPVVRVNMLRILTREGASDAVCTILAKPMTLDDESGAEAMEAVAKSRCTNHFPALMSELEKRVASSSKKRPSFGDSAAAVCAAGVDADTKKRAFAVAKSLLSNDDCWVRTGAVRATMACDAAAARPLLTSLGQDRCRDMQDELKRALGK